MFDFSEDEVLFLLAAAVAGAWGFIVWYRAVLPKPLFHNPARSTGRGQLLLAPVLCLSAAGIVIWNWSDPVAVAGHLDYTLLFLVGAAAWFSITAAALGALGLHVRFDVVEAGNGAAALALSGAVLGATLIYAGGNIGAGPTIWTTILPAAAGSLALALLWILLGTVTSLGDAITIDRDGASAIRTAGWVVGASLILGRAVAGDWTSWNDTFSDFIRLGWPAAALTLLAIALQVAWRPTPERPHPSKRAASALALAFVLLALRYVTWLPAPEIGERVITYEEYMNSR
jgi:hypothetical protein